MELLWARLFWMLLLNITNFSERDIAVRNVVVTAFAVGTSAASGKYILFLLLMCAVAVGAEC